MLIIHFSFLEKMRTEQKVELWTWEADSSRNVSEFELVALGDHLDEETDGIIPNFFILSCFILKQGLATLQLPLNSWYS
jgi:hypothetical protein